MKRIILLAALTVFGAATTNAQTAKKSTKTGLSEFIILLKLSIIFIF